MNRLLLNHFEYVPKEHSFLIQISLSELENWLDGVFDKDQLSIWNLVMAVLDVFGPRVDVQVHEPQVVACQQLVVSLNNLQSKNKKLNP